MRHSYRLCLFFKTKKSLKNSVLTYNGFIYIKHYKENHNGKKRIKQEVSFCIS